MADKKISQLTAATLPLAGTEVLPIVQSSTTDNITVNNLAAGNLKSQSTTGVLQVSGPAAATTRVMTVPNANFTVARTDAAQSFTGDQTLSTGNLVQGTATKGVNFTANTPAAGMTSQLLNWYEEGTFTAGRTGFVETLSGGTITSNGTYTRIGRLVFINIALVPAGGATITATSGIGSYFTGIPFTPSVSTSGTWVNASSVAETGGVWMNTDKNMYLATGWITGANHTRVFSATFAV